MAKSILPKGARHEILLSRVAEVTEIVWNELFGIKYFKAPDEDAAIFARAFISNFLQRGIAPEDFGGEIKKRKIAQTINTLVEGLNATPAEIYGFFRTSKNSFFNDPKTIESKIRLVTGMLTAGHLPLPERSLYLPTLRKAQNLVLTNFTYGDLVNRKEQQIYMVAMLTTLSGCSVSEAFTQHGYGVTVKKTNDDRAAEVRALLTGISDEHWERIAPLAEKAGIERPATAPKNPDRHRMVQEAILRRKIKNEPDAP